MGITLGPELRWLHSGCSPLNSDISILHTSGYLYIIAEVWVKLSFDNIFLSKMIYYIVLAIAIVDFRHLKGLFTNFEYIIFFSCLTKRNIFCKRSISIKPLWLEIIEKRGCTKSVRLSTIIYIIYIHGLTLCTLFSQLFRVRVVLSRWAFYKKYFFCWDANKFDIFKIVEQSL